MASNSFSIEPNDAILRAVINGDNALSPVNPANIIFDGFGPSYCGVFMGGVVADGELTETSTNHWQITIPYPGGLTFAAANLPSVIWMAEDTDGGWEYFYAQNLISVSGSGIEYANGQYLQSFCYPTTTGIILGSKITGSGGSTPTRPASYCYRVFQV